MPILIRDTPLGREIYQEGLQEGRQEALREGLQEARVEGARLAVLRLTGLMLRQRFGDDPRTDAIAERLAATPRPRWSALRSGNVVAGNSA